MPLEFPKPQLQRKNTIDLFGNNFKPLLPYLAREGSSKKWSRRSKFDPGYYEVASLLACPSCCNLLVDRFHLNISPRPLPKQGKE